MAKRPVGIKIEDEAFKKDVDRLLNLFKTSKRKEILRKAARPLVSEMKKTSEFDDFTGEARKSIKSMTFKQSKDYFVGPKLGNFISKRKRRGKYKKFDPYYMYFIEYGFTNVWSGTYIAPTNFIQKAVDASRSEVLTKIKSEVEGELRPFTR